jgi:hypothetical protein
MEDIKLIKVVDRTELAEVQDRFLIRDYTDKRLFIGDQTSILEEIKTDKSHNWAKIFLYGGN